MKLLLTESDFLCVFLKTEEKASDWAESFSDVPDDVAQRWLAVQKAWEDLQNEIDASSYPTVTREAPARIAEREEREAAKAKAEREAAHLDEIQRFWKEKSCALEAVMEKAAHS